MPILLLTDNLQLVVPLLTAKGKNSVFYFKVSATGGEKIVLANKKNSFQLQ